MGTQPVCTIVGVGPGLGVSLARRFGREGFRVALLARKRMALESFSQELSREGIESATFTVDASDADDVKRVIAQVERQLGATEVLVYNAAVLRQGLPSQLSPDTLVEEFKVNVVGAAAAVQAALPSMRSNRRGTILLSGGGLALEPSPLYASLAIGKAGIRSLALSFAEELRPEGIHVSTVTICGLIQPGTPFAPDKLADRYWALHQQPAEQWRPEDVVR
jgi:short-subunit dehydrogenase